MLAGSFSIVDVVVNNIGSAPRVLCGPQSDLPYGAVRTEQIVHFLRCYFEGQVANKQDAVHVWAQSLFLHFFFWVYLSAISVGFIVKKNIFLGISFYFDRIYRC